MKNRGRLCGGPLPNGRGSDESTVAAGMSRGSDEIRAVGGALVAGEQVVGFVVVEEALHPGIPLEGAAQTHGGMGEQAGAARAVTDLGGGRGLLAGADAGEPVQMVIVAGTGMQMDFAIPDAGGEDAAIAGVERLLSGQSSQGAVGIVVGARHQI